MSTFLKRIVTGLQRRKNPRRRGRGAAARARMSLETLETRLVPAGNNWSEYNYDGLGSRDNTAEHTLSPDNVGGLQVLWSHPTRGIVAGTPAVVGNAVYAGDSTGMF
jgi:hypothetical protein